MRVPRPKMSALRHRGKLLFIMFSLRTGWVGMLTLGRSGRITSALTRPGRPPRQKAWTRRRWPR